MSTPDKTLNNMPDDLRDWIAPELLLRYVLEGAQIAAEHGEPGDAPLPAGLPRTWLTVLTYAYAIGLSGSDDIELKSRVDPQLAYAASSACISAYILRHFRRSHRQCLRQALTLVLTRVWRRRMFSGGDSLILSPKRLEACAEQRIACAVLADTMALDT